MNHRIAIRRSARSLLLLLTAALLQAACGATSEGEQDRPVGPADEWCALPATVVVDGGRDALVRAVAEAQPGAVIRLKPGEYAPIRIDKPLTLLGLDDKGNCAPRLGQGGPRIAGLETVDRPEAVRIAGVGLEGPVGLTGEVELRRFHIDRGEVGLKVSGKVSAAEFLITGCSIGIENHGELEAVNGLVVRNGDAGILAGGVPRLRMLTVSENGGHGVHIRSGETVITDTLITDNGGFGLFEEVPAGALSDLSFARNAEGHYGAAESGEARFHRPIPPDEIATYSLLMSGDREHNQPLLARSGILRAHIEAAALNPVGGEGPAAVAERYRPALPLAFARNEPLTSVDALGERRVPGTGVGALETRKRVNPDGPRVLYTSPDGDDGNPGTRSAPLARISTASERIAEGGEVRVLPGRYEDSVYVFNKNLVIRGVSAADEPLTDPEGELPVIDPSETGAPAHGMFLMGVNRNTRIEGLAFENAITGLVVLGKGDTAPPSPVLRALRFENNRKGIDADMVRGTLSDSVVRDNKLGMDLRAVAVWTITNSLFDRNGVDISHSFGVMEGAADSVIKGNRFTGGGGLRVDDLLARDGCELIIEDNEFQDTALIVHEGSPSSVVVIRNNRLIDSRFAVESDPWAAPQIRAQGNGVGPDDLELSGEGWLRPSDPDAWEHIPAGPAQRSGGFTDPERRVYPYAAPIALSPKGDRLYAVAADYNGLGVFEPGPASERLGFVATGMDPRSLAVSPDGRTILVSNLGSGTVAFVDADSLEITERVSVGVEPYGTVIDEAGRFAYVALSGDDEIVKLDLASRSVVGRVQVAAKPRGLAIWGSGSGRKLFVTHFTPKHREDLPGATLDEMVPVVSVLDLPSLSEPREIELPAVESPHFPPAKAHLMQAAAVRGNRVYLPSFGATPERPDDVVMNGRLLLQFETTIQGLLTVIDAEAEAVIPEETVNLNRQGNTFNGPYQIAFSPKSDRAWLAVYGNDALLRLDLVKGAPPVTVEPWRATVDIKVGGNPRGVAVDEDSGFLYSVNFSTGDLSVVDLSGSVETARTLLGPRQRDRLSQEGRHGKVLFYSAFMDAMAGDFWITCATCHPDGRADGITWLNPYGPRSTTTLAGSLETLPLHFDADRDELDDFEHTVRDQMAGFSLAKGQVPPELGPERLSSRKTEWSAIRAYIREGVDAPRAPSPIGGEEAGRDHFRTLGCPACHGGTHFTSSRLPENPVVEGKQMVNTLRDVGTKTERDTIGYGAYDPPSLWGVGRTAPYLHDGSAHTLRAVFENPKHLYAGLPPERERPELSDREMDELVAFVRSIESGTPPVEDHLEPNDRLEKAVPIEPGSSYTGLIAAGEDWFALTLEEAGAWAVDVRTPASSESARARLYDASGAVVAESEGSLVSELPAGRYRLVILGNGQPYDLLVEKR